ncbi:MAG TPA: hypothetical protein VMU21_12260 [Thermodesulfovibrionales bacterium]|nr:hypothetical protein [Thermodesulfovibrionales bacterium]
MVSQDMRKVIMFPDVTTAYILRMKQLKKSPINPLWFISRVYPMEKRDTGKATREIIITKNPEMPSPEKSTSKTDEIGRGDKERGSPKQRKRPKTVKFRAPAAERIKE